MVNTYNLIRKIHLYTAFVVGAFLFMYFITGGVLIMHTVFPRHTKEELSKTITIKEEQNESEIIESICSQFDIRGFRRRSERSDGTVAITFTHPGTWSQILLTPQSETVDIKIRKGTFASVMNDFHRLRGFDGSIHIVWAIFYDLSSIALILFSISGIYLWWKLIKKKLLGFIFLFISTGLTLFTIMYQLSIG